MNQHPVEGCRLNPPALDNPIHQPHQINVQVTDVIRIKDAASAQLVVVQVRSLSGGSSSQPPLHIGSRCLVKFSDSLYNHYQNGVDPFLWADSSYQHEVTAYKRLVDVQGDRIPFFYGSCTTTIQTPFDKSMLGEAMDLLETIYQGSCERDVRCILMEKIDGATLRDLPHDIPDNISQAIMEEIVNSESQIFRRDVRHNDLSSRNIIVSGLDLDRPKVIIIDFEHSAVGYRGSADDSPEQDERKMPSVYIPLLLRWNAGWFGGQKGPADFEPWIRWDWPTWLNDTYKNEIRLVTPQMKAVFLSDRALKRAGMRWEFVI